MTLVQTSTLVTAPKSGTISKYELKMNSKVNTNEVVVNDKADDLYSKIYNCYSNLNKYFKSISDEYTNCANKSVKGDKIVASLKKVAKNCANQGKYCLNRQKNLKTLYSKATTEKNTNELNDAISELQASNTTLKNQYNTLSEDTTQLKNNYNDLQGSYNDLTENYNNLFNNYNDVNDQLKALQSVVDNLSNGNGVK